MRYHSINRGDTVEVNTLCFAAVRTQYVFIVQTSVQ